MAVRTKQLGGTNNIGTASSVIYTVPSGETTIIKEVSIYNRHATNPVTVTIGRGAAAAATNNGTFIRETIQPQTALRISLWMVVAATVQISAIASIATAATVYMSGAELEGVAD